MWQPTNTECQKIQQKANQIKYTWTVKQRKRKIKKAKPKIKLVKKQRQIG